MCEDIGRIERKHKPQEEKRKLNRQRKNAYSNCKLPRNERSPSLLMQKQERERLPPPLYVPCSYGQGCGEVRTFHPMHCCLGWRMVQLLAKQCVWGNPQNWNTGSSHDPESLLLRYWPSHLCHKRHGEAIQIGEDLSWLRVARKAWQSSWRQEQVAEVPPVLSQQETVGSVSRDDCLPAP